MHRPGERGKDRVSRRRERERKKKEIAKDSRLSLFPKKEPSDSPLSRRCLYPFMLISVIHSTNWQSLLCSLSLSPSITSSLFHLLLFLRARPLCCSSPSSFLTTSHLLFLCLFFLFLLLVLLYVCRWLRENRL